MQQSKSIFQVQADVKVDKLDISIGKVNIKQTDKLGISTTAKNSDISDNSLRALAKE